MRDTPKDLALSTRLEQHFGDRVVRCFTPRQGSVNAFWQQAVRQRPQAEALVSGERRLTWSDWQDQVLRLAQGLAAHGVTRGDRVALLLGNDIEFVLTVFAVTALGAIAVPLSTREQTPGLAYILRHSGAKVLVHDAALVERLPAPAEMPALTLCVEVGATGEAGAGGAWRVLPWSALVVAEPLAQVVEVAEEDVALIMYTSGTTGFPKGAMLTHLNIVHSVMHYQQAFALGPQDRAVVAVPLSHVTGVVALMMVMAHVGGTLVIAPQFKATDFLAQAERERMSYTILVPAMYQLCLLQAGFDGYNLSAWRVGGYGGAPMPTATIDTLAVHLPQLGLSNCYGATETTSPATIMPPQYTAVHLGSVGRAVRCADITVMDEDGREVPRGEVGEIWIKGPMVVKGYWANPQATAEQIVGGWWRSGDIGCVDDEGFVSVLDRRKDMLNRGGYKIYSVEVENVLCQHPAVLEAAVVAKPCPVLGERVHVHVTLKAGGAVTDSVLRAFCSARLSDYKVPESYTIGEEALPRNANGKVLKRDLREALLRTQ